jgi:hypothetical protein
MSKPDEHSTQTTIRPFHIDVPQADLDELKERLSRTRWTEEVEEAGWDYGTSLAVCFSQTLRVKINTRKHHEGTRSHYHTSRTP